MITRGGWKAIKIWTEHEESNAINSGFYAIHKPRTSDESVPIYHDSNGKAKAGLLCINGPPTYNKHPADIIDFEGE